MGRQNREMKAFTSAKNVRDTLIEQLKKCNSPEDLERFLKKYNENQRKRVSSTTLTSHHQEEIRKLDVQIEELTSILKKRFSPQAPITASSHEQSETGSVVLEGENITTTQVSAEPMKKHSLKQEEDQIEIFSEKEEKETLGALDEKQPPKSLSDDDKHQQQIHVDPRITKQRLVHMFEVRLKLRAIETKLGIYEEKVRNYRKEKNQKEVSKYQEAATAAKSIHVQINNLTKQYLLNGDLVGFKSKCQDILSDDKPHVKTLRSHRGWWEKFLDDLVNLINTGLNHVGTSVRMHELSMFKPLADGGKKITELNNVISSLTPLG